MSIALDGFSGQSAVGLTTKPTFSGSISMTGVKETTIDSLPSVSVRVDVTNCRGSQSFDAFLTLHFPGTGTASGTFTATPRAPFGSGQTCTYTITPTSGTTVGTVLTGTFTTAALAPVPTVYYDEAIFTISGDCGTVAALKSGASGAEVSLIDNTGLPRLETYCKFGNAELYTLPLLDGRILVRQTIVVSPLDLRRAIFTIDPTTLELGPEYTGAIPEGGGWVLVKAEKAEAVVGTSTVPAVPGSTFGAYSIFNTPNGQLYYNGTAIDASDHDVIVAFSNPKP